MSEQQEAMDALAPEMLEDKAYCGISGLWVLPKDHPFNLACQWHDQQYALAAKGIVKGPDSSAVDDELIRMFFDIAGENLELQLLAHLAKWACRGWGATHWPEAAKS